MELPQLKLQKFQHQIIHLQPVTTIHHLSLVEQAHGLHTRTESHPHAGERHSLAPMLRCTLLSTTPQAHMSPAGFYDENGSNNDGDSYWIVPQDCHGADHDVAFNHWEDNSTEKARAVTTGMTVGRLLRVYTQHPIKGIKIFPCFLFLFFQQHLLD